MSVPLYVADAFAVGPFTGNPAAVCLLDEPADEAWMQSVAAEMRHSETAFVVPRRDGFGLRWFTPAVEAELCGHATLATAHVLWEAGRLEPDEPARFHTVFSGQLGARLDGELVEIDLPAATPAPGPIDPAYARALGADVLAAARAKKWLVVELTDESTVRGLAPDIDALARLPEGGAVIVTAAGSNGDHDFVSRVFVPSVGIPEDPVTGAAHCLLGPYWRARAGRDEMRAFQASARGGEVRVRLAGDRALLAGRARTVVRGELA